MVYYGRVQGGVVVLDNSAVLPEGAEVRIEIVEAAQETGEDTGPTLYERLKPIIGAAEGLPPDAATNLDHYLYGHPKQ